MYPSEQVAFNSKTHYSHYFPQITYWKHVTSIYQSRNSSYWSLVYLPPMCSWSFSLLYSISHQSATNLPHQTFWTFLTLTSLYLRSRSSSSVLPDV